MSNAFAIAGVTAALKNLVNTWLNASQRDTDAVPNFKITAQPPDRVQVDAEAVRLNLFLYEVAPNTGWASSREPSRNLAGERQTNPPLALDLYYLVSALGNGDLDAEILLGHAMQALHENAGLSRDALRALFDPGLEDGEGRLPYRQRKQFLELAEQLEGIRLSPVFLKPEEMSKIWSSINSQYRTSVVYRATVVLIEARGAARAPLPVLQRGPDDRGVFVQPDVVPALPTLLSVHPPGRQPASPADGQLKIFGHHLGGQRLEARLRHRRLGTTHSLVAPKVRLRAPDPEGLDANERALLSPLAGLCVVVDLSGIAGELVAGWYELELALERRGDSGPRVSNALTVAIAPGFEVAGPDAPEVRWLEDGRLEVELTCSALRLGQPAVLALDTHELPLVSAVPDRERRFLFAGRPGEELHGSLLARLCVEGVESLFLRFEGGRPRFDDGQRIQIP